MFGNISYRLCSQLGTTNWPGKEDSRVAGRKVRETLGGASQYFVSWSSPETWHPLEQGGEAGGGGGGGQGPRDQIAPVPGPQTRDGRPLWAEEAGRGQRIEVAQRRGGEGGGLLAGFSFICAARQSTQQFAARHPLEKAFCC